MMTHTLRYDAGAGAYDRLTGRWSRMYVEAALDATRVTAGSHVLDVATGTGDAAIVAADRVGRNGPGGCDRRAWTATGARAERAVLAESSRVARRRTWLTQSEMYFNGDATECLAFEWYRDFDIGDG